MSDRDNDRRGFYDWLSENGTLIGGFMTIALAIGFVVTIIQQIFG